MTISGVAGGSGMQATVNLRIDCHAETVESVRRLAESAPYLLSSLERLVSIVTEDTTKFPANRIVDAGMALEEAAHAISSARGE